MNLTTKEDYVNLYEQIMNDPTSKKIEYTISSKYVRDLTPVFGIKEFIANFYDANGTDFEMNYQSNSLVLKDNNDGVNIKYMIIGNSGSRENQQKIGEHGEGFKIGALTLIREGYKVLIHTVGYTIAFGIEFSDVLNTDIMFAKYQPNTVKKGTQMYLECKRGDFTKAKNMFLFLNNFKQINPSIIIMKPKSKTIYLNGLEHTKKVAVFSYNIREKNQVSNRDRNFINQEVLERNLIKVYEDLFDSEEIEQIMNGFMEHTKDFDKMLEAKIVNKLSLSEEQKEMFRNALDPNDWYTINIKNVDDDTLKSKNVIEISNELFNFLTYIKANVLISENISMENVDGVIKTFIIEEDNLTFLNVAEMGIAEMLGKNITPSFSNHTISFHMGDFLDYSFNSQTFENYLKEFTLTNRAYKRLNNDDKLKNILNNLIFLSCNSEFKISIIINEILYSFVSYKMDNKYYIQIRSGQSDKYSDFELKIKRKIDFENRYQKFKENHIYLYNLKYQEINSLYSYQVKDIDSDYYMNNEISNILSTIIVKNGTKFFEELLITSSFNLYEHSLSVRISESSKKKLIKVFKEKYPNYYISSLYAIGEEEKYDTIVEDLYNCKKLKVNQNFGRWLANNGIPTSKSIYLEKQNNGIQSIPYSKEMKLAVKVFRETYGDNDVKIELTMSLPNKEESTHKDGVIYISQEATTIPYYLAALIGYEYVKLKNKYPSPSHELQSKLTHNLLG